MSHLRPTRTTRPHLPVIALAAAAALAALAVAAGSAHAQQAPQAGVDTHWVNWTKDTPTTMSGKLKLDSGPVTVKFSGPTIFFKQLGAPGDRDYWTAANPDPWAVTGRPTGTDIIGFIGGTGRTKYKLTFSRPVTDPVLAILSLGSTSTPTRYNFAQTPTLVSSGAGFYGGCPACLWVDGQSAVGTEGHGVVRFVGTYESITWTLPEFENWNGIQVGAPPAQ